MTHLDNLTTPNTIVIAAVTIAIGIFVIRQNRGVKEKGDESWESHVRRHGAIEAIWQDKLYLLEADGCDRGPPTRNMILYRLPPIEASDGKSHRLVIFNAIAVTEDTLSAILKLGIPTVMIVPNSFHRCCAGVWKKRFPNLVVACPSVALEHVKQVVPVTCSVEELALSEEYRPWIHARCIDGWREIENVIEFELGTFSGKDQGERIQKKAVCVCDLLFTMPYKENSHFVERLFVWFFDSCIQLPTSNKDIMIPKVARIGRIFGILDWSKVERWYRSYAKEEGKHIAAILVGHGPPVVEVDPSDGCTKSFEGIADQLIKPRW